MRRTPGGSTRYDRQSGSGGQPRPRWVRRRL